MPPSPTGRRPDPGPIPASTAPRALYVHSPFCTHRCPYCDFAIAIARPELGHAEFLEGLRLESERVASERLSPRTVFVGGGTPSALQGAELERFFEILTRGFDLRRVREYTLEANPEDIDEERSRAFVRHGVTRVSLGAQSFDPATLRLLGRRHDGADIARAVRTLRGAGMPRINVDLIFAPPTQTPATLDRDLDQLLELEPDHVSTYCLTFESGTPMTVARDAGRLRAATDEQEIAAYRTVRQRLGDAGFEHYEISNFARPGARCHHNLVYWRNLPYFGLGPGAVTYADGERRKNEPKLAAWLDKLRRGEDPTVEREHLAPEPALRESVVVALRTRAGAREHRLRRRFGMGFERLDAAALDRFESTGLLRRVDGRLHLTERGFEVADGVSAELL